MNKLKFFSWHTLGWVSYESSWWVCSHGIVKSFAHWFWHSSKIGEQWPPEDFTKNRLVVLRAKADTEKKELEFLFEFAVCTNMVEKCTWRGWGRALYLLAGCYKFLIFMDEKCVRARIFLAKKFRFMCKSAFNWIAKILQAQNSSDYREVNIFPKDQVTSYQIVNRKRSPISGSIIHALWHGAICFVTKLNANTKTKFVLATWCCPK